MGSFKETIAKRLPDFENDKHETPWFIFLENLYKT